MQQSFTTLRIMTRKAHLARWPVKAGCALLLAAPYAVVAPAQPPAAAPPTPAKQSIDDRKALFTLIGGNFRPIAEILRGNVSYESVNVGKYATRVSFLTTFLTDAFPEVSKIGDTRAKAQIWSQRADFDRKVKEFRDHALALSEVAARLEGNTDAFKSAARAVAQDCKSCHDDYRNK